MGPVDIVIVAAHRHLFAVDPILELYQEPIEIPVARRPGPAELRVLGDPVWGRIDLVLSHLFGEPSPSISRARRRWSIAAPRARASCRDARSLLLPRSRPRSVSRRRHERARSGRLVQRTPSEISEGVPVLILNVGPFI